MSETASVLLVDDDPRSAELARSVLTGAGYHVRVLTSFAEVTHAAEAAPPDIILVGLDSLVSEAAVLVDRLSQHRSTRHIPTLLLGGPGATPSNGLSQPAARLAKPLEPAALVDAVRRCLCDEAPASRERRGDPDPSTGDADAESKVVAKLTSETVRIQEEERRKLSVELHDDIAQILGNLVLMMDACLAIAPAEAERLRRYLYDARETAKEGFRRVQQFSVDLRPPMLDDLGLAPTILWYAERFTRENDIPVAVSLPDRLPSLSGEQETAIFRVVQAALHNVRKHAQAVHVTITLEQRQDCLHLAIVDDGVGFDQNEVERKVSEGVHLGLAGMRYRTKLLKGSFDVISAPGRGTAVVADIPLGVSARRGSW